MKHATSALASAQPSVFEPRRLLRECPICGDEYLADQVVVVEVEGGNQLVHMTCARCHNALVALMVESALGMSSVGMITDLSVADMNRGREQRPITEEQVLSLHQFLQQTYCFETMIQDHFEINNNNEV